MPYTGRIGVVLLNRILVCRHDAFYRTDETAGHGTERWTVLNRTPSERPIDILLVEDNPGDIRLTEEGFKEARVANDLHVVRNGTEALDFLFQRGDYRDAPQPDVILLSLNLPGMDGTELLEEINESPELQLTPVIVLTSSQAEEDIVRSYMNDANAYLTKPVDGDSFVQLVRSIGEFWIKMVELPPVDR